MKITRKIALQLLEKTFGNIEHGSDADSRIGNLCSYLPNQLQKDFQKYWSLIDTEDDSVISARYNRDENINKSKNDMVSTLRLMIAFHFIEDTYK